MKRFALTCACGLVAVALAAGAVWARGGGGGHGGGGHGGGHMGGGHMSGGHRGGGHVGGSRMGAARMGGSRTGGSRMGGSRTGSGRVGMAGAHRGGARGNVRPSSRRPGNNTVRPTSRRPGNNTVRPTSRRPGNNTVRPSTRRPGNNTVHAGNRPGHPGHPNHPHPPHPHPPHPHPPHPHPHPHPRPDILHALLNCLQSGRCGGDLGDALSAVCCGDDLTPAQCQCLADACNDASLSDDDRAAIASACECYPVGDATDEAGPDYGVQVTNLVEDGAAERQGLVLNDIILSYAGMRTQTFEDLAAAVQQAGDQAEVVFLNSENGQTESMTLCPEDGRIGVGGVSVPVPAEQ